MTVLRRGRTLSQLTATMRNPGEAAGHTSGRGVRWSASRLRVHRPGDAAGVPPAARVPVVPRRAARGRGDRGKPFRYWEHVEGRPGARARAMGGLRADDVGTRVLDAVRRPAAPRRTGRSIRSRSCTLCDTQPGAVGERMGPNVPDVAPAERRPHRARVRTSRRPSGCSRTTAPTTPATGTRRPRSSSGIPEHGPDRLRDAADVLRVPRRPAEPRTRCARPG